MLRNLVFSVDVLGTWLGLFFVLSPQGSIWGEIQGIVHAEHAVYPEIYPQTMFKCVLWNPTHLSNQTYTE